MAKIFAQRIFQIIIKVNRVRIPHTVYISVRSKPEAVIFLIFPVIVIVTRKFAAACEITYLVVFKTTLFQSVNCTQIHLRLHLFICNILGHLRIEETAFLYF